MMTEKQVECGCGCGGKKSVKRVEATLCIRRAELLYDVKGAAFVAAEALKEEEGHSRHQLQDIAEEGNVNLVTRTLNLVWAECVEMLHAYTKKNVEEEDPAPDDILRAPAVYRTTLSLPEDFSTTTVQLIEHLVHEYMVCRVLIEWFSLIGIKTGAEYATGKATTLRAEILQALHGARRVRRPLKPW